MTVKVVYTKDGEEQEIEFDNELEASIFITGLRNHDHRSYDVSFGSIEYPERTRSTTEQ